MTSVLAPAKNITLQGIAPDVIQSCVLVPAVPAPTPEPEDVIYAPVAPGITYGSLPVITTGTTPGNLVIVDTSPDQIIGCANDVGTDPQSRLNALFPSAVDGDGVVDRATNNIWVYDGATWNNVGPTPGPTLTVSSTIPPWNEILVYDARVRTRLEVNGLAYALELLTEPAAYGITLGMTVQTSQALVRVPAAAQSLAVQLPAVSSGGSVLPPSATTTFAALVPQVSSGGAVIAPATDISFAASMVPYIGPRATVVQAAVGLLTLTAPVPQVSSGAAPAVPAADLTTAALVPVVISKPAPTIVTIRTSSGSASSFIMTGVTANQDDILLALVETSGDGTPLAPLPDGTIGGIFQAVTGSPVTDVATAAGSTLQAWWLRCSSSFTSRSVTIDDSGDHQLAAIVIIRGCVTTGNPWDITATDTKTVASTTASAPAVTTTVGNTLVISTVSRPNDSISTTDFGTPVNNVLSNFTDRGELGTSAGNGGGFVITSGVKTAPGDTGVTSFASAPNTTNAAITIAFKP